jgi:hypothetical protein
MQKRALAKEPQSDGKTTAQAKAQSWIKHPPVHAAPAGQQKVLFHEEHAITTKCKKEFCYNS